MTVAESLKKWLRGNTDVKLITKCSTDFLEATTDSLGIYKQPSDDVTTFIDGSKEVTSYYFMLVRQSAKIEKERLSNIDFMERFESWVDAQNLAGNFPSGIGCENIAVANTHYMQEMDTDGAVYQISLAVTYFR